MTREGYSMAGEELKDLFGAAVVSQVIGPGGPLASLADYRPAYTSESAPENKGPSFSPV